MRQKDKKKENILILDFCETLVKIQTADDFIDFVTKKNLIRRFVFILIKLVVNFKILSIVNHFLRTQISLKSLLTFSLFGIEKYRMYEYGKLYSTNKLYNLSKFNVINEIKKNIKKNNPQKLIILSGGYDYYMYQFAQHHGIEIDWIITSKINFFKNKNLIGGLSVDCMHYNKYLLLKEKLCINKYSITFFTDDIEADSSIINISKNVFIVKGDAITSYENI